MRLRYGTHFVTEDEPCLALREEARTAPNGTKHRYQIVWVMRHDKPAEYRRDMGLAKKFNPDLFWIPGGVIGDKIYIEETVGSLREHAEDMRRHPFDKYELVQVDKIKNMAT